MNKVASEIKGLTDCPIASAVPAPTAVERPPHERDVRRLASAATVSLVGKLGGRGIHLLADVVRAHILGPANFGLFAVGWTLSRVVTLVSPLGLNMGVIRYGARYWGKDPESLKGVVLQSVKLALLSGLSIGACIYLAAPWIGEKLFGMPSVVPVIQSFAFVIPLMTTLRVAAAATRISQRMKFAALSEDISQPAFDLLVLLGLYAVGWRLVGALVANVVSFGLALLLAIRYVKNLYPETISSAVRQKHPGFELLSFSLPASFSGIFGLLLVWIDRLFVAHFRPIAEVGIYQAASQLSIGFAVILAGFGSIVTPMATDLFHLKEMRRLEELFRISTKWSLYASLPPFLVMCLVPRDVMGVLYGAAYKAGWKALIILGIGQLVNAGTGPVTNILTMTGQQNQLLGISGAMLLLSISLNFILIPRWGMVGASVATATALTGMMVWAILQAKRSLRIQPYDRRYLKGLFGSVLTLSALFLVRWFGIRSSSLSLLTNSVVATVGFGTTLLLFGLDLEDRNFLELIRSRLHSN
jgi:O-antigen/teichoic acid export membrane protein